MIQQSDIQGRLRLFRYGIIAVVVITFVAVLIAPFAWANSYVAPAVEAGLSPPQITDFLGQAVISAVIAAVLGIITYVIYHYLLTKQMPMMGDSSGSSEQAAGS